MRLKTLRKERPAFENEGTVISGSRMDISNNESKPLKHRSNNLFALPASLNNDLSSLSISTPDRVHELDTQHAHQTSTLEKLIQPAPSQATRASSYQAIEAAYLEHGIRIHFNPTTAAAVSQQHSQSLGNNSERKSENGIQRQKVFIHRNPSRSSSALHYASGIQDPAYQDSRPFSALQHASTTVFEEPQPQNECQNQIAGNQRKLRGSEELNNGCTSSILVSEHSDGMILNSHGVATNDAQTTGTSADNDPDLAYMSSLLQTTNGDAFRDTIRRRAGLRPTLAVHRRSQPTRTSTNSKQAEKPSVLQSPTANHRNSSLRQSTVTAPLPATTAPSKKKLEKDIVKHATRIRASHIREYFVHSDNTLKSYPIKHLSSLSNSPTRTTHSKKRNKSNKAVKSISMEPLEILLAPATRSLPPRTQPYTNSLSLHDFPSLTHNHYQEITRFSKTRTKSPKNYSIESNSTIHDETITTISFSEPSVISSLNNQSLPIMRASPLGMISNNTLRQSNSFDSGCYDRCSSSADTQSVISYSVNQTSTSVPSTRLTSASTRRSNINKKVSFQDQSKAIIVTTAIYV